MNISRSLYTILSAHAGLTALVGDRIYPVQAPQQKVMPYITFSINDHVAINRQNGVSCADYVYPDIDIVASTVDANESIATEVRNALDRVAESIYSGLKFGPSLFENMVGPEYNDEDDNYLSTISFKIFIHR